VTQHKAKWTRSHRTCSKPQSSTDTYRTVFLLSWGKWTDNFIISNREVKGRTHNCKQMKWSGIYLDPSNMKMGWRILLREELHYLYRLLTAAVKFETKDRKCTNNSARKTSWFERSLRYIRCYFSYTGYIVSNDRIWSELTSMLGHARSNSGLFQGNILAFACTDWGKPHRHVSPAMTRTGDSQMEVQRLAAI